MTKKRAPQAPAVSQKTVSRAEREKRQRKVLYIVAGITVALVVLVLGSGLYQEYIAKPAAPVATVDGKAITTRDYQMRVLLRRAELSNYIGQLQTQLASLDPTVEGQQFLIEYFQQQLQQVQGEAASLPLSVLDEVIDEELVRQEAARRGLGVTPDELQEEIEQQFGYERNPPTPTPTPITATIATTLTATPSPTVMTQEMFAKNYGDYVASLVKDVGVTEAHFRRLFELNVLRRELQESLATEVPTSAEQVRARHILVATQEEADQIIERLKGGEDFADLAAELSLDTSNNLQGGDLGWFSRGQMVTEFDEAAFTLQPGETSGVVQSTFGFHIINVLEREADRPLDDAALESKKSAALQDWLAEKRESDIVRRYWTSSMIPPSR